MLSDWFFAKSIIWFYTTIIMESWHWVKISHFMGWFICLFFHSSQILFGCVAQYTIMPSFGLIISKALGLSPSLTVGLILLACCPGGTASNVVLLLLSYFVFSTHKFTESICKHVFWSSECSNWGKKPYCLPYLIQ